MAFAEAKLNLFGRKDHALRVWTKKSPRLRFAAGSIFYPQSLASPGPRSIFLPLSKAKGGVCQIGLTDFLTINPIKNMKKEVIYLMVLVEIKSNFENVSDSVHEVESEAILTITDTPNVKVLNTEILLTRIRNLKR